MLERRSILINGLRTTLSRPGALLWTYAVNLGLALLFSLQLHAQLAEVLDHSLASQRLTSGFDLGSAILAFHSLSAHAHSAGSPNHAAIPLYVAIYFILVPGTLFTYLTAAPARLSVLVGEGIAFFWRFVRVTLITLLISAIFLVPLILAEDAWSDWVTETHTGTQVFFLQLPGIVLIVLVACLLRLYFDLVEVYTVQIGQCLLPSGRPDRRVRRTLMPALRTLRHNFARAYGTFVLLATAGLAAMLILSRVAVHMLAQPRVWPMFLVAQIGLFLMLFTRFWQRGAETILARDNPILFAEVVKEPSSMPTPEPIDDSSRDPLPNPEPIPPSLPEADPGIFHHDPPNLP